MATSSSSYTYAKANEARDDCRKKGKPFCKVCFDAGKEYASHYLKTLEGELICPTLLNQSCLTCGQRGHTSSYCPTNHIESPELSSREKYHYNPKSNPFGSLDQSESDPESMTERMTERMLKPLAPTPLQPPQFQCMPPKSQFWWQDEDDEDD